MSLQKQISIHAHKLTTMEEHLLRKLLKNKDSLTWQTFTIEYLAERFSVSKTSVHRFTQKLGYSSFLYFKEDYFYSRSEENIDLSSKNHYLETLSYNYELINQSMDDEIIEKMMKAEKIMIYGMGMSKFLGRMFQIKLQLYGKSVEQYDDSRYMRVSARALNPKTDLVFVLSRTGRPPELVEAIVEASLLKVDIVLISETLSSPLANMANYIIQTAPSDDPDLAIDTRLNTHIAMDLLMNKFIESKEKEEKNSDKFSKNN